MDVSSGLLLRPNTYRVLERVPVEWMEKDIVVHDIAVALSLDEGRVSRTLAFLRNIGAIEQQKRQTIAPFDEVRRAPGK